MVHEVQIPIWPDGTGMRVSVVADQPARYWQALKNVGDIRHALVFV